MLPLIHKRTQQSKRWKSCSFQALPGKQTDSPRNSEKRNIYFYKYKNVHVFHKSQTKLDHITCYWNNYYISFLLREKKEED